MVGDAQVAPFNLNLVTTTAFALSLSGGIGDTSRLAGMTTFTAMKTLLEGNRLNEGLAALVMSAYQEHEQIAEATTVQPCEAEEPLGYSECSTKKHEDCLSQTALAM